MLRKLSGSGDQRCVSSSEQPNIGVAREGEGDSSCSFKGLGSQWWAARGCSDGLTHHWGHQRVEEVSSVSGAFANAQVAKAEAVWQPTDVAVKRRHCFVFKWQNPNYSYCVVL